MNARKKLEIRMNQEVKYSLRKNKRYVIAPCSDYIEILNSCEFGEIITLEQLKRKIADKYQADATCPVTSLRNIKYIAYASEENFQECKMHLYPYWRLVMKNNRLIRDFEFQKELLEAEGHKIICINRDNYLDM